MKKLFLSALALLILSPASFAVTWKVASVSLVVRAPNTATGGILTTVLNNRKYLDEAVRRSNAPKSDLFIGIREDTLSLAVVRRSTQTVVIDIVALGGGSAVTSNAAGTKGFAVANVTIRSLNTEFGGILHDSFRATAVGEFKSISRHVIGGNGSQTIRGTITTTGRNIEL